MWAGWFWCWTGFLGKADRDTYQAFHLAADRFVTEVVAGLNYRAPGTKGEDISDEETDHYHMSLQRAAKDVKYPDRLPFPLTFFAYGKGLPLDPSLVKMKAPSAIHDRVVGGWQLGHLMSNTGVVYGFILSELENGETAFWFEVIRSEGGWQNGGRWIGDLNLEPWVLPNLVHLINEHRKFVIESPLPKAQRQSFKDNRKKFGVKDNKGHVPPPFYILKLQTQVVHERVQVAFPQAPRGPKAYRSDVRGHERCRIRRGPMPIDPKLSEKLTHRGYRVFANEPLDEDTHRRLAERGLAYKREGEWVAVKTAWVVDHQSPKNPELPYIPAVRVPTKRFISTGGET